MKKLVAMLLTLTMLVTAVLPVWAEDASSGASSGTPAGEMTDASSGAPAGSKASTGDRPCP